MSLPDTVFIFVLALIIFGPKKLPEIGRQIGKLVGEFRRASNEFKYQIEEELRQVDLMEKPASRTTIAASTDTTTAEPSSFLSPDAVAEAASDPAASLPVGQHPNIETLNTAELNLPAPDYSGSEIPHIEAENPEPPTMPTIAPAEGVEARTTPRYTAASASPEHLNGSTEPAENGVQSQTAETETHRPVPVEAEIGHD